MHTIEDRESMSGYFDSIRRAEMNTGWKRARRWVRRAVEVPRDFWLGIRYGIPNLCAFAPIAWSDRDWDFAYFLGLMEFKLKRMATLEEKYGHHVGSTRDARRMRVCVTLCQRLQEDNYLIAPTYFKNHLCSPHSSKQNWRDAAYLFHILGRYGLGWWD